MDFIFVGAGDSVPACTLEPSQLPGYARIQELISSADVALTNLEGSTPCEPWYPAYKEDPVHVAYGEQALDTLKTLGFQVFCTANNHAGDYGTRGIIDTIQALKKRKLSFAGTGMDLQEADAPAYITTKGGTAAVLGVTCSFLPESQAGISGMGRPGKPGVNMLRTIPKETLPEELYAQFTQIVSALELPVKRNSDGIFFEGRHYVPGIRRQSDYEACQDDLNRIGAVLDQARRQADYVIVTLHDHLGQGGIECAQQPSGLIVQTARQWIDAGADLVFIHGAHQLRPMEIYRSRPIFYSAGNFMLNLTGLNRHPAGDLSHFGCDSLNDYIRFLCTMFQGDEPWESILPRITFRETGDIKIEIYPLQLIHPEEQLVPYYGLPTLASGMCGREILDRFAQMSDGISPLMTQEEHDNLCVGVLMIPSHR